MKSDRAKSGASHFLALIFLLVIPATDVEGHGPDPAVGACANAEAAALALALRAVTRDDPESAEMLLERWEALSARCAKSMTEPDPVNVQRGFAGDRPAEYEASLLRGQRQACRQGKWEYREAVDKLRSSDGLIELSSLVEPFSATLVASLFHILLEDAYLLMMRLCGPLELPLDSKEYEEVQDQEEYEAALIHEQRKACEKELANWTPGAFLLRASARFSGKVFDVADWPAFERGRQRAGDHPGVSPIAAGNIEDAYHMVVSLCAPLTPVARDMLDDDWGSDIPGADRR